jgi:hypothetical protein
MHLVRGEARTHREGRLDVVDLHVVQDDALEVAHGLGGAIEACELLLLENGPEGLLGGRPGAAGLLQAEVVERGLDRDDKVALERVLGVGNAEVVALAELVRRGHRGRIGHVERGKRVGGRGSSLLGANGHLRAWGSEELS